jgi:hypothetical protein
MNTGQLLLVIGALTLLSIVTLSVNSMLLSKTTAILQSEAHLTAISVAQSMLDEIMVAAFDSATASKRIYPGQESKLTPISSLGPEGTEITYVTLPEVPDTGVPYRSVTKYNDADDYNNYQRYYFSSSLGIFTVVDSIFYVTSSDPDVKSGTPTFFKRILVTVRHRNFYPPDSLSLYNPWNGKYYLQLSDIAVYRRYF